MWSALGICNFCLLFCCSNIVVVLVRIFRNKGCLYCLIKYVLTKKCSPNTHTHTHVYINMHNICKNPCIFLEYLHILNHCKPEVSNPWPESHVSTSQIFFLPFDVDCRWNLMIFWLEIALFLKSENFNILTWDGTPVSQAIGEHSDHLANV